MSELATNNEERAAVAEVVNVLTEARLLTTNNDERIGDPVIDVSHEALIRGWPRLRGWVEEDRPGWRALIRLNEIAQEWQRENDESLLYRGARLAVMLEWRTRNQAKLSDLERQFLDASEAHRIREEQKAEEARQRELQLARELAETERRSRIILKYFFAGTMLLLIISLLAFIIAYRQRQQALAESKKNEQLLYASDINLAQQMYRSGNLSRAHEILEAYLKKGQDLRGFEWYYLMAQYHNERTTLEKCADSVFAVAFSQDGKWLATGSGDDVVKIWDTASLSLVATFAGNTSESVLALAFSSDGRTLAVGSGDKTVRLWDIASKSPLPPLVEHTGAVYAVEFSPDGKLLATGSSDNTVKLWEVASRRQ
jgi:predicted NACHT family NTPase